MNVTSLVAEKAMFDIFETWNASNPELSRALNWSLSTNPCTNWSGVTCLQSDQNEEVNSLRYLTYLVP